MSITLLCLVKGNATANAFPVHIDGNSLVGDLKEAIKAKKQNDFAGIDTDKLKLWKIEIPGDLVDPLSNLTLQDQDKLLAMKKILKYFPDSPLEEVGTYSCLSRTTRDHRHFDPQTGIAWPHRIIGGIA